MADVEAQTKEYRLTGPYGRLVQDAQAKTGQGTTWSTVTYAQGEMLTPTHEELAAHPDRFEAWPPPGTILEGTRAAEEPPDETHRPRSHR